MQSNNKNAMEQKNKFFYFLNIQSYLYKNLNEAFLVINLFDIVFYEKVQFYNSYEKFL